MMYVIRCTWEEARDCGVLARASISRGIADYRRLKNRTLWKVQLSNESAGMRWFGDNWHERQRLMEGMPGLDQIISSQVQKRTNARKNSGREKFREVTEFEQKKENSPCSTSRTITGRSPLALKPKCPSSVSRSMVTTSVNIVDSVVWSHWSAGSLGTSVVWPFLKRQKKI